jgi:CRISPR-associated protein Cmr1
MMTTEMIEAKFAVTTPLFNGGADPQRAELRAPSFKGILRFWWRALAWSRCNGDLEEVRQQEDLLFGSEKSQSRVQIYLPLPQLAPRALNAGDVLELDGFAVGHGARYFGYGLMGATNGPQKLARGCLRPPFEFTVTLRGRDLTDDERKSLKDALIALGTLGGMGARSRRGYGSLVLNDLRFDDKEEWTPTLTIADLRERISQLHRACANAPLPEYTALSTGARHVLLSARNVGPLQLLDRVGKEMVRFRSWGRNGRIPGDSAEPERLFSDDRNLMKLPAKQRGTHPRRIAFGLPHNYGKQKQDEVKPAARGIDRRASPLFVHMHMCGDMPVAVVSFLPARFLPEGEAEISVGGQNVRQAREDELFEPLREFLDRLLDDKRRREQFSEALEVRS